MSVSMTPTRFPARATSTARLAVVFDLPVPPRNEWVEIILAKPYAPFRRKTVMHDDTGRQPPEARRSTKHVHSFIQLVATIRSRPFEAFVPQNSLCNIV